MLLMIGHFLNYFFSVAGLLLFAPLFFVPRAISRKRKCIFLIFYYAFGMGSLLFANTTTARLLVSITVMGIFLWLRFQTVAWKAFSAAVFYMSMQSFLEFFLMILVWGYLGDIFPVIHTNMDSQVFSYLIFALPLQLLFLILLCKKKEAFAKPMDKHTKKEWGVMLFSGIFAIVFMLWIVENGHLVENRYHEIIHLLVCFLVIGLDYFVFWLFSEMTRKNRKIQQEETLSARLQNEIFLYRSLSEQLELQQRNIHEYKHSLEAIAMLARQGDYQTLEKITEKAARNIKSYAKVVDTKHPVVDAVLNFKYREAEEKEVGFLMKINDLSGLMAREEDLIVILSNLLNNAIDAAASSVEKIVRFKFLLEKEQVVLSVQNSHAKEITENDGVFISAKENKNKEHGYGIENVKECVRKYAGKYVIDYDENYFTFSVVWENIREGKSEDG